MPELNVTQLLNQGALVVMAAAFLWLVKTVVGDIRQDLSEIRDLAEAAKSQTDRILDTLQRIERNGRRDGKERGDGS